MGGEEFIPGSLENNEAAALNLLLCSSKHENSKVLNQLLLELLGRQFVPGKSKNFQGPLSSGEVNRGGFYQPGVMLLWLLVRSLRHLGGRKEDDGLINDGCFYLFGPATSVIK